MVPMPNKHLFPPNEIFTRSEESKRPTYGMLQAILGQRFFGLSVPPGRNPESARVYSCFDLRAKWPLLPDLGGQGVCLNVPQLAAFASFQFRFQPLSIQSPCATPVQVRRMVRSVGRSSMGAVEPRRCAD